jgi:hypothetical protein
MGTPHMTDAERKFIIGFLNEEMKRESCPVKSFSPLVGVKSGQTVARGYAEAARGCAAAGKRIPTRKQLEAISSQVQGKMAVAGAGCVWTSTFADGKSPLRKVMRLGPASFDSVAETENCLTVCTD